MEITKQFIKVKSLNKNQMLADEIFNYFHKQIPFWRLMKWMKDLGPIFVYESFVETKKSDCKSEIALFIWKCKTCKIIEV